jgi:predicted nucleotidyltransferase
MTEFGLPQENVDAINDIFAQYASINRVIIYGSRAKGNYKPSSDIDLTIEEDKLPISEFLEIENKLDDLLLPYKIDLSQKRKIANVDLVDHIDRVGKPFYKKSE